MGDSELVVAVMAGPGGRGRSAKVGVAIATSTTEVPRARRPRRPLYVLVDDLLPARGGAGRTPKDQLGGAHRARGRADPVAVPLRAAVPAAGTARRSATCSPTSPSSRAIRSGSD